MYEVADESTSTAPHGDELFVVVRPNESGHTCSGVP